jgi:hypothetical protein
MSRLVLAVSYIAGQSQRQPAGTLHNGNAFRFNKVAEGVYHAVGTGALTVVGNSSVIVNDDDVIVVDDHVSPAGRLRQQGFSAEDAARRADLTKNDAQSGSMTSPAIRAV